MLKSYWSAVFLRERATVNGSLRPARPAWRSLLLLAALKTHQEGPQPPPAPSDQAPRKMVLDGGRGLLPGSAPLAVSRPTRSGDLKPPPACSKSLIVGVGRLREGPRSKWRISSHPYRSPGKRTAWMIWGKKQTGEQGGLSTAHASSWITDERQGDGRR